MAKRTGSKQLLRDLNQNIVLNMIADQGAISRIDLARKSGLPTATITRIANEFILAGLLTEEMSEETNSNGGRRPILLRLNPNAGYVVGVKLEERKVKVVLCDLQCSIIYGLEGDIGEDRAPYKVTKIIAEYVKRCIRESRVPYEKVLGVGMGMAGLVDSARGISLYSPVFQWRDVELGPALRFELQLPVRIDNDVNTLAVAQYQFGPGRAYPSFLHFAIGIGIGAGIIINGDIYRGAHGRAGEFGHTIVDISPDAPFCHCGKRGCLEAIVSDYALIYAATGRPDSKDIRENSSTIVAELAQQARMGDARLAAIFSHAGRMLGIAIANLINTFDPHCIFVEELAAGDQILRPMLETIPLYTFGIAQESIVRVIPFVKDRDWARGAASLILKEVLQPPIYEDQDMFVIDQLLVPGTQKKYRKN